MKVGALQVAGYCQLQLAEVHSNQDKPALAAACLQEAQRLTGEPCVLDSRIQDYRQFAIAPVSDLALSNNTHYCIRTFTAVSRSQRSGGFQFIKMSPGAERGDCG